MERLEQTRLLQKRSFSIDASGVCVRQRRLLSTLDSHVRFEDLSGSSYFFATSSKGWFLASAITAVISAAVLLAAIAGADTESGAWVFWLVVAAGCMTCWYATRTSYRIIEGAGALRMLADRPSEAAVHEFVATVHARRRAHLREHYLPLVRTRAGLNAGLLDFLRLEGAVDEEEYLEVINSEQDLPSPPDGDSEFLN